MNLRIHHFYDIIRDFGIGKKIESHPYEHSYHKIADKIRADPDLRIKIVVGNDAICEGCQHSKENQCDDTIAHRKDFTSKEEFNNQIDKRIMNACSIEKGDIFTPIQLCEKAKKYLEQIEHIYEGNDPEHTQIRKQNVIKGLKYYSESHNFDLDFLD
jgi:hypothetical protein